MKKLLSITLVTASILFMLSACGSDSDDDDDDDNNDPGFTVFVTTENEFVSSTYPAHEALGVPIAADLEVTMSESFPLDLSKLVVEVFGFPNAQNCTINGDGFVCNGEYPLIFDGDPGANTWHSVVGGNRTLATYEVIIENDLISTEGNTVTFELNEELSNDMTYAVHLYYDGSEKVTYTEGDGGTADFHSYWTFTTVSLD